MKNWMSRLALLAVVGSILCSALIVGCGGGAPEDNSAAAPTPTKPAADDTQ
jgi:hypothetical protein